MVIRKGRQRAAFTLVELLVVIAIIGVLVALLLPAVQAAREAARRMQCQNNLKQIAIGVHNHHDVYLFLPHAGSDGPNKDCCNASDRRGWSWAYQLLPFIEQSNLHQQTDDAVVANTPVKTYYCPTRRAPGRYKPTSSAKNDYCANGGDAGGNIGREAPFIRQWETVGSSVPLTTPINQFRRLADLIDGTSQVALVGEKQLHPTSWGYSGGDNEPWNNAGWDQCILRYGNEVPQPDMLDSPSSKPTFWSNRFGSSHPGGLNVARADGSVMHVPFNVDAVLWKNFCMIRDGNPLADPF
jgi:prepilin-type N-terminal cleavage/methylation domain-containing protein/prepilin-type processing-associated H-X9-DG protein